MQLHCERFEVLRYEAPDTCINYSDEVCQRVWSAMIVLPFHMNTLRIFIV
jgi:hypothetical protein